jgi:DTW domain-containing protein
MVDLFRHPEACRRHRQPRCGVCGLHLPLCVCSRIPALQPAQRLVLIQHTVERERPTNTGRLAARFWGGSELLTYGAREAPLDPARLERPADWTCALLFFRDDALEWKEWRARTTDADPERTAIFVPDGSWRQAAHMARRLPALRAMPCVKLPPGPPGLWRIRIPRISSQLCTAEAVIRLAAALGHTQEAAEMLELLRYIHDTMWRMRGHPGAPMEDPLLQKDAP